MSTGGKKSVRKLPRSESSHAKALLCRHMKWCIKQRSSGQRKFPVCTASTISRRSAVYRPVGVNGGGFGLSFGMSASGSPSIWRSMRNFSGSVPRTGRIFWATGLYFFLAYTSARGGRENRGSSCNGEETAVGTDIGDAKENIGLNS